MIPELRANRFAFMNQKGIKIEYSNDGGATWNDYGAPKEYITNLFSIRSYAAFWMGKKEKNADENDLLRVTLIPIDCGIYTYLDKFYIYCHQVNQQDTWCTIESAYGKDLNTFNVNANKVSVGQYDNVINIKPICTWSTNPEYASWQVGKIRFTFGGGKTTGDNVSFRLESIFGFGKYAWETNSNLAKFGRLYSYDSYQNAYFPNKITANQFVGDLNGDAATVNKHTVETNVPPNALFTDTTYDPINPDDVTKLFD